MFAHLGGGKSSINTEDPKLELGKKLLWTYDPAPYVLNKTSTGRSNSIVQIPILSFFGKWHIAMDNFLSYHFHNIVRSTKNSNFVLFQENGTL